MILIRAKTVLESFTKIANKLSDKEFLRNVVISIEDISIPFLLCPGMNYHTTYELQELEDVIAGELVPNGMRYRYTTNPAQFKANGKVDWQYSFDAAPQIEGIRKLMERGQLKDKGFITFWRPDRDMGRYIKRIDAGYDSDLRQRHPCGIVWHYGSVRGGMHITVLNRSIWPLQSYSSDIHIPAAISYYLNARPKSLDMTVLGMKRSRSFTGDQFDTLCKLGTDHHDLVYSAVDPYKPSAKDKFSSLQAGTEACRVGAFHKAHTIMKSFAKGSMYRDWLGVIAVTERQLQLKEVKGNRLYGVKSALQTKALNKAKKFTVKEFLGEMNPRGVLTVMLASDNVKKYAKKGNGKKVDLFSDCVSDSGKEVLELNRELAGE